MNKKKLFFVCNVDWGFLQQFVPRIKAIKEKGLEVTIVANDTGKAEKIKKLGFNFINFPVSRSGTNIFEELRSLLFLFKLYKTEKPDLITHATIKPVIYGSIAARLAGLKVVNFVAGLGYVFSGNKKFLRGFVKLLYKLALLGDNITVFENPDDRAYFIESGLVVKEKTKVIPGLAGGGVDIKKFKFKHEKKGNVVVLAARMLYDKGVKEFVEAAKILKEKGVKAKFLLVGQLDPENPASISEEVLEDWSKKWVDWIGYCENMPKLFAESNLVVLPSYREGLPRVLMEAASCGRAIIASNVPGCREIVKHNVNGLLVPAKDSNALAEAIEKLLKNPKLRKEFGKAGRKLVLEKFSDEKIIKQTFTVYKKILNIKDSDLR